MLVGKNHIFFLFYYHYPANKCFHRKICFQRPAIDAILKITSISWCKKKNTHPYSNENCAANVRITLSIYNLKSSKHICLSWKLIYCFCIPLNTSNHCMKLCHWEIPVTGQPVWRKGNGEHNTFAHWSDKYGGWWLKHACTMFVQRHIRDTIP